MEEGAREILCLQAVLFDLSHSRYLTPRDPRLDSSTSACARPSSDRVQKPPSIQPLFEVFSPKIDSTEFPSSPFLRLQEEEVPFESRKSIGGRHGWIIVEKRMGWLISSFLLGLSNFLLSFIFCFVEMAPSWSKKNLIRRTDRWWNI